MEIQFAGKLFRTGANAIAIKLTDNAGQAVTQAHVTLEGNMAHPGMTPVFTQAVESVPGMYRSTLDLNMPGDWIVTAHAQLAAGGMVERESNLTVTGY